MLRQLRKKIDLALAASSNFHEFYEALQRMGVMIYIERDFNGTIGEKPKTRLRYFIGNKSYGEAENAGILGHDDVMAYFSENKSESVVDDKSKTRRMAS